MYKTFIESRCDMNIKELRQNKFSTANEFAIALGVKPGTIRMIESGRVLPAKSMREKYAELLGVSVDELMSACPTQEQMQEKRSGIAYSIYFTEKEFDDLKAKAEEKNETVSRYIRSQLGFKKEKSLSKGELNSLEKAKSILKKHGLKMSDALNGA